MRVLPFFAILVALLVSSLTVPKGPELVWDVQVVALSDNGYRTLGVTWHGSQSEHFYVTSWARPEIAVEAAIAYLAEHGEARRLARFTGYGESVYVDATWREAGTRLGPEIELLGNLDGDGYLTVKVEAAQCLDGSDSTAQGTSSIERRHKIGDTLQIDIHPTYGDFGTVAILATPTLEE